MECFVQIPGEATGRYVQIMMTLVDTPDSSDVTGILAITDITDQTINDRILHRLTTASYDFVVDINLTADYYRVLTQNDSILCVPPGKLFGVDLLGAELWRYGTERPGAV